MMSDPANLVRLPYAAALRYELGECNRRYAQRMGVNFCESYGENPVVCYAPSEAGTHGNFLDQSYAAILAHDNWKQRLQKVHTRARRSLPANGRRWRELDSCNSSDALLMNIFCYPGTLRGTGVREMLGATLEEHGDAAPRFGYRARVPLGNGRFDRTEVDMRLGNVLVEAKLTENDFQSQRKEVVASYRDFAEVFEERALPQENGAYASYQLIRNVLAAHASGYGFCVICDARRPDLIDAWYAVISAVRCLELRLRCRTLTWQEVARAAPGKLRRFLEEKYGIVAASS